MDTGITVGHPFYFPTQVVLLDDDPDFLDGVSLMLERNLSYKLFQSASQALEYANKAHKQTGLLQRCYTSYKTGPAESDALSHIDISKLHLEVLNGDRFQTASTIVVDYSMPEMTGLDFLIALKNPFIKKILLTGQADMELAIKAFNKQLIDQFIDKHDPKLKQKLNSSILNFQDQYFRSSFKLLTDPIIANNHDAFLVDTAFQEFFARLRERQNCVEYYMIDTPSTGFLMVDSAGTRKCLLIYTDEMLDSHYQRLCALQAPAELLEKVSKGELLPGFNPQETEQDELLQMLAQWSLYYYPGIRIDGRKTYHATLMPDNLLADIHPQSIVPYNSFLEMNSIRHETLH